MVVLIVVVIADFAATPIYGKTRTDREERRIARIKEKVQELKNKTIQIKLVDGRKIVGYIEEIGSEDFVVSSEKTKLKTRIRYSEVKRLKEEPFRGGPNLVPWFLIGGVVILITALTR